MSKLLLTLAVILFGPSSLIAQNESTARLDTHPLQTRQKPDVGGTSANVTQLKVLNSRELVSRVSKSLVMVVTQDAEGSPVSQGSGFFVSPTLVATNLHVLKRASQGYIKVISDGGIYKIADVFGISLNHDVCLLRIKEGPGVPLPEATAEPTVGDDIIVAGNPEGLEGTFSKGIVSGIRSSSQLIQIDAPISPGSSGGPVVNNQGEVIGLAVSSLVNGQNLNFAVPIKYMTDWALDHGISVNTAGHLALAAREAEGFRGPVKTYVESRVKYTYDEHSNKFVPGPWVEIHAKEFTPSGRLAREEFFQDGKRIGSVVWKYSDSGLLERRIDLDPQGH